MFKLTLSDLEIRCHLKIKILSKAWVFTMYSEYSIILIVLTFLESEIFRV